MKVVLHIRSQFGIHFQNGKELWKICYVKWKFERENHLTFSLNVCVGFETKSNSKTT